MATTHGEVHGATTTSQAVPFKQAQALAEPACAAQTQREPNVLSSQAQASHPRVPHAEQPTPVAQPAPSALLPWPLSSLNRSKISSTIPASNFWAYDQTGGIFTIFLCGFDISQVKSHARSLPHFHCSRRRIPS